VPLTLLPLLAVAIGPGVGSGTIQTQHNDVVLPSPGTVISTKVTPTTPSTTTTTTTTTPSTPPKHAPEPATLTLAVLGGGLAGLNWLRRRRRLAASD
jgi:hypothetical protein